MTLNDFNIKWFYFLEPGHYGMDIDNSEVISYMDKEFEEEVKVNKNFSYSQIKLKFGLARVYANSNKTTEWESKINEIICGKA